MSETQVTITEWAAATFGPPPSLERVVVRANEEMAEGLREATSEGDLAKIVEEAADVMIVLARAGSIMGVDLDIAGPSRISLPCMTLSQAFAIANEEMAQFLLSVTCRDVSDPPVGTEIIYLWKKIKAVIEMAGGDPQAAIDAKMAVNRQRKWRGNGWAKDGAGYHITGGAA